MTNPSIHTKDQRNGTTVQEIHHVLVVAVRYYRFSHVIKPILQIFHTNKTGEKKQATYVLASLNRLMSVDAIWCHGSL